jgi:hypothetical protein
MNTRRHSTSIRSKTTTVTLGELIAAAYEASEGYGRRRSERAARLVAHSLARHCSRPVRFVR